MLAVSIVVVVDGVGIEVIVRLNLYAQPVLNCSFSVPEI